MSDPSPTSSAWLIPLPGGPALTPLEIPPTPGGTVMGRHEKCAIRLPPEVDKVSRQHARFIQNAGEWRITDLNSRWGTFINGMKLKPHQEMPLTHGDLVRIVPWTFSFSTKGIPHRGLRAIDDLDTAATLIRTISHQQVKPLHDEMLHLLLESASAIHAAPDEQTLSTLLMDIAMRGTSLPNAAVLKALDANGAIEIIAQRAGPSLRQSGAPAYSRSLLAIASQGVVAEISQGSGGDISQSMLQMQIDAALCVPLMLGSAVAAYLYLDSRAGPSAQPRPLRANAADFCLALAQMAGLALANLKRIDGERRSALIETELKAAAVAQRWILPRQTIRAGSLACTGDSRPGQYLGGDFFDAMILGDGRLAVSLGDVTGHGLAASVLMTAAQGFLHAALSNHCDVARAVTELNAFIYPRKSEGKFITLWVGLFDSKNNTVTYVDAGHGYALLSHPDGACEQLCAGGDMPVGIIPDAVFSTTTAKLLPGQRALILSDGIIEQFETETMTLTGTRKQFELTGVQAALAASTGDDIIPNLFQAVYQFAGTKNLADDATAVLVTW